MFGVTLISWRRNFLHMLICHGFDIHIVVEPLKLIRLKCASHHLKDNPTITHFKRSNLTVQSGNIPVKPLELGSNKTYTKPARRRAQSLQHSTTFTSLSLKLYYKPSLKFIKVVQSLTAAESGKLTDYHISRHVVSIFKYLTTTTTHA